MVELVSIVEFSEQDKEVFKLVIEIYIAIEQQEIAHHISQLTEDVRHD